MNSRIISTEDLDLLTQDQVCAILRLKPSGLRRRIYLGQAPRPRHGRGSRGLWRRQDIENFKGHAP